MSLFVAVRPDEGASEDLEHAVERVRRLPASAGLHWQPPAQWHVTLAFLGDADDEVADAVADRIDGLGTRAAVPGLRIRGAGCFGRQILWMGLGDETAVAGLSALAAAIPARLRGTGVRTDRRPWRPHLTVARARHGDARPASEALASYGGPPWQARELILVRSTGGPHPAHLVTHTVPLASPESVD